MNILVSKLARSTSEETIQQLFAKHGSVASCDLVLDKETGKSKGFAFVDMPNDAEANAAIKQLNFAKIDNQSIRVKEAKSGNAG